ncbi:hypothetical protein OAS72_00030 [Candidatus Pelagibacter sp.]|nr:hypothetical protein [Candidatus Pelagibacter sp.]
MNFKKTIFTILFTLTLGVGAYANKEIIKYGVTQVNTPNSFLKRWTN